LANTKANAEPAGHEKLGKKWLLKSGS
jgi:hypothetical protein